MTGILMIVYALVTLCL